MKLKNKKTGEIIAFGDVSIGTTANNGGHHPYRNYGSIAELNEEWEDYEEPKVYYYISDFGAIRECEIGRYPEDEEDRKQIGNYFNTREEAEKAVEKLKAWKLLKDEGAEFYGWRRNQTGTYELYMRWEDRIPRSYEVKNDIDLLFGGEE